MCTQKYLNAILVQRQNRLDNGNLTFRIEVGFGFVPEQLPLIQQHPALDQPGNRRQLAQAFSEKRHLKIAFGAPIEIETVTNLLNTAAQNGLYRMGA